MSVPAAAISAETSPKLVPSEEIESNAADQAAPCEPFEKWLTEICSRIESDNSAEELQRIRKTVRNHHYYRGRQSGYFSAITGQWVDLQSSDVVYTKNYVRALVKKTAAQWARSNTELKVYAKSDKRGAKAGARAADKITEFYQQSLLPESAKQREAKFVKLSGESYRYWYWCAEAGPLVDQPVFEQREIQISEDSYQCGDCQQGGAAVEAAFGCPNCGSDQISQIPGQTAQVPTITGYKKVPAGDLVLEIVDPLEVKLDLHARTLDESPYLRRKRMVMKERIKSKFKWFQVPSTSGNNEAMHFQSQLEVSPGNTNSATTGTTYAVSRSSADHNVEFNQIWLDRVYYEDYIFPADTNVGPKGEVMSIPRGTKAVDIFPSGMYIARAGGVTVDVRDEDKRKHWTMIVDDLIPGSIHGDGIDDVIELQDLLNDVHSLRFEYIMRCVCSPTYYDGRMFKGEQFSSDPGSNVPVMNLQPGQKIEDGIFSRPPSGLDNHVDEFIEITQRDMVEFLGAESLQGSAPDTKNGTATAAQLNHDQAAGLSAVPLALKGEADVKTFSCCLEIARDHWTDDRYLPLLGAHGRVEGQFFQKSDIPDDFMMVAIEHSWMPRNQSERRADFMASFQISPMLPLGPYTPGIPGYLSRQIAERFGLELDDDGFAPFARRAEELLQKVVTFAEMADEMQQEQQIPDPMLAQMAQQQSVQMILAKVKPNPIVDDPTITTEIVKEWFATDEGMDATDFVVHIVNQWVMSVRQAKLQWEAEAQMEQMQVAAPLAQAGNAVQQHAQIGQGAPEPGSDSGQDKSQPPPSGNDQSQPQQAMQ